MTDPYLLFQPFQYWREILRAIRSHTYSNTNCNRDSNCHTNADSDPKPDAYAHALHGEMFTHAATASYTSATSLTRAA